MNKQIQDPKEQNKDTINLLIINFNRFLFNLINAIQL